VVPVVVGTAAFYLGKKVAIATMVLPWHSGTIATDIMCMSFTTQVITLVQATEYHSHKWTLYLRAVNGEDLTHLVSKVCLTSISRHILLFARDVSMTNICVAGGLPVAS